MKTMYQVCKCYTEDGNGIVQAIFPTREMAEEFIKCKKVDYFVEEYKYDIIDEFKEEIRLDRKRIKFYEKMLTSEFKNFLDPAIDLEKFVLYFEKLKIGIRIEIERYLINIFYKNKYLDTFPKGNVNGVDVDMFIKYVAERKNNATKDIIKNKKLLNKLCENKINIDDLDTYFFDMCKYFNDFEVIEVPLCENNNDFVDIDVFCFE